MATEKGTSLLVRADPIPIDVEKAPSEQTVTTSVTASESTEASQDDGEPDSGLSRTQIHISMAALCLNVLLSAMDQSIVATALPVMAAEFKSSSAYTWVGSAYLLGTAASGPNWGKTSDIFGRKPAVFAATVLFMVGSIMCGVAKTMGVLIAGRAVAGVGGGGINLMALVCVADMVSIRKRSLYIGFISTVWSFATAFGPVLGGVFTSKVSWRWCFWINLPIGAVALVVLYFFLHIKTPKITLAEGLRQIDWSGTCLVVPGTILFLFGLETGGVINPWSSAVVICCLVFGFLLWTLFLVNEKYIPKRPIMPLSLFRTRSAVACIAISLLHGLLALAGPYYLPLYFQAVLGASPIMSGVYIIPYNVILSAGALIVSVYTNKTGLYYPVIIGTMAVACLGHGLLINLPLEAGWAKIIIYTMIAGFGIGPNYPTPMIAFQNSLEKSQNAVGIAAFAFVRTAAASISIVIGGTIFQNSMQTKLPVLQEALGPQIADALSGRSAEANVGLISTLPSAQQLIVRRAFLDSLSDMWIFYCVVGGVGALVATLISEC